MSACYVDSSWNLQEKPLRVSLLQSLDRKFIICHLSFRTVSTEKIGLIILLPFNFSRQFSSSNNQQKHAHLNAYFILQATTKWLQKPKITVERLELLLCIWKVLSSNLGPETNYLDWDLTLFSSVYPDKCKDSTLNWAMTTFFHNLSSSLFITNVIIQCCYSLNSCQHWYINHN